MAVWGAVGQLFGSMNILGAGLLLAAIGIVIAILRGTTKEREIWLPAAGGFCWMAAIILVQQPIAALGLFITGAIANVMAYLQVYSQNKNQRVNLFHLAIIGMFINLSLMAGTMAMVPVMSMQLDQSTIATTLEGADGFAQGWTENPQDTTGACAPGNTTCTNQIQAGVEDNILYDIIGGMLAIASAIVRVAILAGYAILGPLIVYQMIWPLIANPIIGFLVLVMINMWTLAVAVNIIYFILSNRGT